MQIMARILEGTMSQMQRRVDMSDRAHFLLFRWLVFAGMLALTVYAYHEETSWQQMSLPFTVTLLYAASNLALLFVRQISFNSFRWAAGIFLLDLTLVGFALYGSVGIDTDLYMICFLIVYLSTLGKRLKDAVPLAVIATLIYVGMLWRENPDQNFMDARLLLRFPFFFILALFTSYLSEEADKNRRRLAELERSKSRLQMERDDAMSELEKKQAELIQAEKLSAMGHMAGALAHEIRNPLCVILGYVGDLLETMNPEDSLRKPLEMVYRCADRCNKLVNNLLNFSRLPKSKETFSITEVVEEALTLARLGTKSINVKMVTDFRAAPKMTGRRSEIQQVILNLGINAIDAMPAAGTLTARVDREVSLGHEMIVIRIEDTGQGIPEALQRRIFDPFFTTKEPGKGTGLGLCIVSDILRSYQGTIEVQSEVGKGTAMIIRLPSAQQHATLSCAA